MLRPVRFLAVVLTSWTTLVGACVAQSLDQGSFAVPRSVIVTLETDRMFDESNFGKRVASEIEKRSIELASENRTIEAELIEEERRLTELRPSTTPAEFSELAKAFDEKVQNLRQSQNAKARALGTQSDETRQQFLQATQPILLAIMQEANAAIIIERRNTIVALDAIDITDIAIERINETLGDRLDGSDLPKE